MLFEIDNLNISFGAVEALKDFSLSIREGEKIALIGHSGAGKSTLLNQLQKMQPQQSAVIYQHYALVRQLSVFHNVYMGRLDQSPLLKNLRNFVLPQAQVQAEISPLLTQVGLQNFSRKTVGNLSGGEQQRVAIARALYRQAPILLGDEPVSSVDPHQAEQIVAQLMQLDATVILSLHSVELALKHADRIVALRKGRLHFDLPTEKVEREMLRELYDPV